MKRPSHIFVRLSYRGREHPVLSVLSFAEHPTLLKWISKYGTDTITLPSVPYESLSDALPSFWGEMRRYAFSSIAEFFKAYWTPPKDEEDEAEEEGGAEEEEDIAEAEEEIAEEEPAEDEDAEETAEAEDEAEPAEDDEDTAHQPADPFCIEKMLCGKSVVFHPETLEVEWVDPDEFYDPYISVTGLDLEFKEILSMIRVLKPEEKDMHEYFSRKIKYHMSWRRQMPSKLVCHFDNARENEDDEIDSSYL